MIIFVFLRWDYSLQTLNTLFVFFLVWKTRFLLISAFGKTLSIIYFIGLHAGYTLFKSSSLAESVLGHSLDEEFVLYEFLAISLFAYLHLVICVVWEITTILGIKCFRIPYKKDGDEKKKK